MKKIIEDTRKLTMTGGTTYYLTLPQSMIKQLKWKKGEKKTIRLVESENRIVIEDWKG